MMMNRRNFAAAVVAGAYYDRGIDDDNQRRSAFLLSHLLKPSLYRRAGGQSLQFGAQELLHRLTLPSRTGGPINTAGCRRTRAYCCA